MKLNSLFLLLGVLFFLFSCKQEQTTTPLSGRTPLLENYTLGAFNHGTLTIKARFTECGEWGGHLEKITMDIFTPLLVLCWC
jgi:hypothetical protein